MPGRGLWRELSFLQGISAQVEEGTLVQLRTGTEGHVSILIIVASIGEKLTLVDLQSGLLAQQSSLA
jgi:hypothetical protein